MMVSTGISALRSACRHSAWPPRQALGAGGADVVLAQHLEQRRAHDARQDRGLRQRQRDGRQDQRLAGRASRPASQPGKPPAGNQRRCTAKSSTSSIANQKFGTATPSCVSAHHADVGRRVPRRAAAKMPTGMAIAVEARSAIDGQRQR